MGFDDQQPANQGPCDKEDQERHPDEGQQGPGEASRHGRKTGESQPREVSLRKISDPFDIGVKPWTLVVITL